MREPLAVIVPRENVNDETVKLVAWLAAEGQAVAAGQAVAEIETSKAVLEMRAPQAGHLRRRRAEGAEVRVGEVLFYLTADPKQALPEESSRPEGAPPPADGASFSDKARRLVEENRLDPALFAGRGLVRESDVLEVLARAGAEDPAIKVEKLPRRKLTEIRYLSAGQNAGLASAVSVLCPTRGLRALAAKRDDWGSSLTPVVIHEAALLLRRHPVFNAYYEGEAVHYYRAVNVGFAIDADNGLKVPVIRDADKKSLVDIAREMQDHVLRYVEDELDVAALTDGTFTITDLSGEGAFGIAPLINYRQSAILAVGAEFFPRGQAEGWFQLALAFDHRATEGRAAAAFLRELRESLARREEGALR